MKAIFSLLTVLLLVSAFSEANAQTNYMEVPAGKKYKIYYSSTNVIFQDTTAGLSGTLMKPYAYPKAVLYATFDKYTGGTVTIYRQGSTKPIFRSLVSLVRVVGVVSTDSLKVKSLAETL